MGKKHTYGGKTYDADKAYRDKNGDTWTFTGRGQQMNTSGGHMADESPLSWVEDFRGPLVEL